jgi:hypothetical protein
MNLDVVAPIAQSQAAGSSFAVRCSALLKAMFDERTSLFAYSTTLREGRYVNDFAHPGVFRYTINSLVGIQRAQMFQNLGWEITPIIDSFLTLHSQRVTNAGDIGLLLFLLAAAGHPQAESWLFRAERIATDPAAAFSLTVQDFAWLLVGLTKQAELSGASRAIRAAECCWSVLHERFFNPNTALPFYKLSPYRRRFTSFGGVAYFLWATAEFARVFNNSEARAAFDAGVQQVLNLQGARGEWPWFMSATNGRVLDPYQLYSVHQDSMSMLFLLPACDAGLARASAAIEKSCSWLFGGNELGAVMVVDSPFFVYRSIRRKERFERQRRYLRALRADMFGCCEKPLPTACLEVNRECRSYHIGWLLFVWGGRNAGNGLPALFESRHAA